MAPLDLTLGDLERSVRVTHILKAYISKEQSKAIWYCLH